MVGVHIVLSGPVRVVVADDHPIWRSGLRADLSRWGPADTGPVETGRRVADVVADRFH